MSRPRRASAGWWAGFVRMLQVAGLAACIIVLVGTLAPVAPAQAQDLKPVPPLTGRVVDTTGTLDAAQREALAEALASIESRKGAQVAILMVPTTDPEPIETFSIRVAENWQLGRGEVDGRPVDDGVLLLVAKEDRRVRIEVGYGLEGAIPDVLAKRIIEERIVPRFRAGDFSGGLAEGVAAIGMLIEGEALPPPRRVEDRAEGFDWMALLVFAFVGGSILTSVLGRLLGAGVGSLAAVGVALLLGASLLVAIFAALGVFLLLFLFGTARRAGRRLRGHTYRGGTVFLPGGGWGGGGGFGGGGFGGGGGGFGGGGASGSW